MAETYASLAASLSDRYAIDRELGRGGMATVYLAQDKKHDRKVAIKVLRRELTASVGAERFLREIQIAARLAHPHILPLIDSGEAHGALYYVTPHVPDGSLRQRLERERRMPLDEAIRIARDVGVALDYAHRQGFVHRDVKPENILFADGHAVLADFGIARAFSGVGGEVVTEGGLALGTPEYMSPEQASGEQDLGGRSDLYSLACVVYELLAGEPPLRGRGARATMAKQVTEIPRPLRALRPDAPARIERVVARAPAQNPPERVVAVAPVLAAPPGEGAGLRISAQLTSTEDGQLLWSERYDRTLADVFAIQEEIARTIVDTLRATSFADLTAPAARRYTHSIAAYGWYLKGRYAWNKRTQEDITDAIRYFEQAIAEDPDYAPAYAGLSDSYALQLDYRSVPVAEGFARAQEYARKALELDETVAEAHASLGWVLFIYDWDWDGAAREFKRAITLDPRYPTAHQWFAFYLAAMGRLDEALVAGHTALELDPASVSIRRSVGWLYFYARRYDQARYHLSRAIAMNPTAAETYRVLALAFAQQGQWAEAERATREGMALAAAGPYTMATLGYGLARAGRRGGAEELLAGLEARGRLGYVSPVAFATLHLGLERWHDALEWIERAYEERRGWLAYLKVNAIMDPLRGDPRFARLLERMRL